MKKILGLGLLLIALATMAQNTRSLIPNSISPGAKIAIITPASAADSSTVVRAMDALVQRGYVPQVFPYTFGKEFGSFPTEDDNRVSDLMSAFTDPEIEAIICTRGGYGTTRMLPLIDTLAIQANPKWFVGYSDISAVHALLHKAGIASIHGPMMGHIAEHAEDSVDIATDLLFDIMEKGLPYQIEIPTHEYNNLGNATGSLVGGNLIVINNLAETPYDIINIGDKEDAILFIEEVSEKIYAVERMLVRMHQSGALSKLKGLLIGQFTDYKPDDDFDTMEDMIHAWLVEWGYYDRTDFPIVFNFPVGHGDINFPVVSGAQTIVNVTPTTTTIIQQ